ncbi:MAG TPA: hypothetical protein VNB64_05110 [Solirubrobacteraceae bacterium]|nr:hypothetical protein [Solirubrobacteraceae bacterium]
MRKALCAAVLGALALPGSALAADTTSDITGSVGSELSLSVAAPAAMTMTHATAGTSSSLVTVTSTSPTWTLSIRDASATTPGQMDRVSGTGPASLSSPLEWKLNGAGSYNNLTATAATVTTGSLLGTVLMDFRQAVGTTEAVRAADTYSLTATYTVT